MTETNILTSTIKDVMKDVMGEDLIIQAFKEMIKDEIKKTLRKKFEEDPELWEELKSSVKLYYAAKVKEMYASILLAKGGAKLAYSLVPDDMKHDVSTELEAEIAKFLDKLLL